MLTPVLTPHGLLTLEPTGEAPGLEKAFGRGAGHGLLWLGANEVGTTLPPVLSYWRELATRYVTALCAVPGISEGRTKPPVPAPNAGHVIERILESGERLGRFPYMGHQGRAPGTYEWVIPGLPYILVYQVRHDDELVIVMAVFDGAQDR
jgi:hypothetical protein